MPPATRPKPARNDGLSYRSEEDAFPRVTPRHQPLGNLVQVMLRVPLVQTDSGFLRHSEERQTERDNLQVAKVISVGPLAFRNRNTYEFWPEGAWCAVGDYVRVPKHQGDYSVVKFIRRVALPEGGAQEIEDSVVFANFKDLALLGVYRAQDGAPDAEAALAERYFE